MDEKIVLEPGKTCSYYGEPLKSPVYTFSSSAEAEKIIARIIAVIGLKPHFKIMAADVPNAAAVIYNSERYVLYNPSFISSLNKAAGNEWASVSILAHEIGHHLNGHTLEDGGSRPEIELEADEFSGFVLRKLGASLNDAQVAMKIAADVKASHTHPAKKDRLAAIDRGWRNADDRQAGTTTVKKTNQDVEKPVVVPQPTHESPLAEKYIAKDIFFSADPKGKYYVTIRNHLVKVEGQDLYVIGMFAKSNKPGFSYMLYDKQYNYLYINSGGLIVNGNGRRVGRVRTHE